MSFPLWHSSVAPKYPQVSVQTPQQPCKSLHHSPSSVISASTHFPPLHNTQDVPSHAILESRGNSLSSPCWPQSFSPLGLSSFCPLHLEYPQAPLHLFPGRLLLSFRLLPLPCFRGAASLGPTAGFSAPPCSPTVPPGALLQHRLLIA